MQLLSLTHPTICHSARERVQADPCLLLLFPNLYARTVSSITLLIHLIHRLTSISVKNLSKFPSQLPYLYCSVTALPVFTYLFLIYLFRSMVEKYCSQLTHSIPFPGEYQLYSHSHVRHHWTSIHVEMKKSCSPYNSPLQSTFTIWSNAQHNSHRNQHRDQRSRLWAFQSQQTTSQQTSTRKKKKKNHCEPHQARFHFWCTQQDAPQAPGRFPSSFEPFSTHKDHCTWHQSWAPARLPAPPVEQEPLPSPPRTDIL